MAKISIIGAGMFGYALAYVYGRRYPDEKLYLFDVDEELVGQIGKTRQHPVHFSGRKLPENVVLTSGMEKAVRHAEILLMSVPAQRMRSAVSEVKKHISRDIAIVDLAKALELRTGKRMSEVIAEELEGSGHKADICVLAGGMLAGDVISGKPICAELASESEESSRRIAGALTTPSIRLYANTDVMGVELAGALKNVVAIGAGMFDGMFGEGDRAVSSKAGLLSRAAKELKRFALAMGAGEHTFNPGSQAWFGDLMTTCFGNSRNRLFGEMVVKLGSAGKALDRMKEQNKLVEGYATAKVLHEICRKKEIEVPVCGKVYGVLYEGKSPEKAVEELMSRPLKSINE